MATPYQQKSRLTNVTTDLRMEKVAPKRVFINNIDSYASRHIAKILVESVSRSPDDSDDKLEEDTESYRSEAGGVFQVVGTVSDHPEEDTQSVLEHYHRPSREDLLSKLMVCDFIVYNITQHVDQVEEAYWAVSALHKNIGDFSGPKVFILVSTVLTWACSKPVDPDDPEQVFTDTVYMRRKSHPSFKQHLDLEKKVVKLGKTNKMLFSTYVLASGLQYGMGEQVFHYFFKTSWLGHEHEIPVFGDGNNIVPTIHVSDLARVVQRVIEHRPKPQYLLAKDSSNNTLEDIVKAVATVLGPGKIQKKPFEEAALIQDLSTMELESILTNLCMYAVHIQSLFTVHWSCEYGLVENIEQVVEEYRQVRGLLPIRICVLGPPAVGKSTVCERICERYKLHHITLKDIKPENVPQEEDTKNADPDAEDPDAENPDSNTEDNMEQDGDILDDQLKLLKDKLTSNSCRNQGFVLDDFPETFEQAKEFFDDEEHEDSLRSSQVFSSIKKILPEFVFYLEASDDFLMERVINLPEVEVQKHNYEMEHFQRRLARYREKNMEEMVSNYFMELDIKTVSLEITSDSESDMLLLIQKIFDTVGSPKNYGSTRQEVEDEERRKTEERMMKEAKEKAEIEQREEEEARARAVHWEEWTKRQEKEREKIEKELEAQAAVMKNYLKEHVMPVLTRGLTEVCGVQPEDPVDFLAEYLYKNNTTDF